jgi:hypothetical protein
MNRIGWRLALLSVLLASACGPRGDGGVAADSTAAGAPAAEMDATAVAESSRVQNQRAVAQMNALDSADALDYRKREASMQSYSSCMAQAKDLPPEHRRVIEAACARRRGAPR